MSAEVGFRLPIKLRPIKISQGWHGPFSHYNGWILATDLSHAVDFAVPWGTAVYASGPGMIEPLDYWGRWYGGDNPAIGAKTRTNLTIIRHDSGLISVYSHLETGSVSTKWHRRDYVDAGEIIGVTGRSGWVPEHCPHLHFQVFRESGKMYESVRYSFIDYQGPLEDSLIRRH